jgi:hypothetical protein
MDYHNCYRDRKLDEGKTMDTLPSEKLFSSAKQSPTRNWNLPAGNERGPIVQLMDLEKVAGACGQALRGTLLRH